ncbi:MAG: hypothetical protein IPK26_11775 [Planctomycetes bacterium]|nr:hypothetical protein [Planctomycetota bacterium]
MQARTFLLLAVAAACSAPSPTESNAQISGRELTLAEGRARYPAPKKPGTSGAREAAEWRRMRMLDENGNLDPFARRAALAERAANVDYHQSIDNGGIGRYGWTERGPDNIGGRTRALLVHPTVPARLFAGTVGGGIWRSDNSGLSWTPVSDFMGNLAVCCLEFDPSNSSIIWAGTGEGYGNGDALAGEGIWRSTNGGTTWTQLPSTTGFLRTNRIAVSQANGNTVLAATNGGIRRSTDGGTTWTTVRTGNSYQVLIDPANANNCVAHVNDGVHRIVYSTNGGSTWTNATGTFSTGTRIELAYAPANAGWVYASLGSGQCWRSTNGGASWTQRTTTAISNGSQWWYDNAIWVDPVDSNYVVIGAVDIWRSSNGGQTFTKVSDGYINTSQAHPDVHFFANDPGYDGSSNLVFYACTDGSVYRTTNIRTVSTTSGWSRRDQDLRCVQYYGVAGHSSGKLVGGTQDNGTHTIPGGSNTAMLTYGADGGYAAIDPTDSNYIYGETQNLGMHRSTDGGVSGTSITTGLLDAGSCTNFIAPFALSVNNVNYLFAGGCSLWRCANAKAATPTWTSIKASIGSSISAVAIAPTNVNIVWIGHNNGQVYRTANATAATPTWTTVDNNGTSNPLPARAITAILIDRTNTSSVLVALGGFNGDNLRRTTNNGTTFTDVTGVGVTGLPSAPIYAIAQHPTLTGRYYVGTEVGAFGTSDNCATWSTSNDGPADVSVDDITFLHGTSTLLVGTHGRGMWTTTIREADVTALGAGCAGSAGTPALSATDPHIGENVDITCTNLVANQVVWLVQGTSSTSWLGNALPFDLAAFGAPTCFLRVSADIVRDGTSNGTGVYSASLPIAANTGLLGRIFYLQLVANDPPANAWDHTVSNALTLTIGN